MLNRFTYWMSAAAIMASAAGCAHHSREVNEDQVQQMTEFRLSREDVVEVSVWKEGELSRNVPSRSLA